MRCAVASAGASIRSGMAFLSFWLMKPRSSLPELGILPAFSGILRLFGRTMTQIVNRETHYRHPQLSLRS